MIYFRCLAKHRVIRLLSDSPDETLYNILPSGYGDVVYFKVIFGQITDITTGIPKSGELKTLKFDNSTIHLEWLRNIRLKTFIKLAEEETQGNMNYLRVLFCYDEKDFNSITLDNWGKDIKPTLLDPIFDFRCYLYSMEIG